MMSPAAAPRAARARARLFPAHAHLITSAQTHRSTSRAARASALTPTAAGAVHAALCPAPRTTKPNRRGVQTHATPFKSHREYLRTRRNQPRTTLYISFECSALAACSQQYTLKQPPRPEPLLCSRPESKRSSARLKSQCRPPNRTSEVLLPRRTVRRCAEPERAAPSGRHTQTRIAPFTSRADHRKPTRRVPARVGQFRHQSGGTHAATPAKGA